MMKKKVFMYNGDRINRNRRQKHAREVTDVVVRNLTTSIPNKCFQRWNHLQSCSCEVPPSLTNIGYAAFEDCISLTDITIPASCQRLGSDAFRGCVALSHIILPETLIHLETKNLFFGCDSLSNITLPSTLTEIGESMFRLCYSITTFSIPPSVISIQPYAFHQCVSLSQIQIPSSVTMIGRESFGSTALVYLHIPHSVNLMGPHIIQDCTSLQMLYIPLRLATSIPNPEYGTSLHSELLLLTSSSSSSSAAAAATDVTVPSSLYRHEQLPTLHLADIQSCIEAMPNNIEPNQQLSSLQQIFTQQQRKAGRCASQQKCNLLHILTQYPNDTTPLINDLLQKCPQALYSYNTKGWNPLHTLLLNPHMHENVFAFLCRSYELQVVHSSIWNLNVSWDSILLIVHEMKMRSLIVPYCSYSNNSTNNNHDNDGNNNGNNNGREEGVEYEGFYPFMIASVSTHRTLSMSFELLRSRPDALKMVIGGGGGKETAMVAEVSTKDVPIDCHKKKAKSKKSKSSKRKRRKRDRKQSK